MSDDPPSESTDAKASPPEADEASDAPAGDDPAAEAVTGATPPAPDDAADDAAGAVSDAADGASGATAPDAAASEATPHTASPATDDASTARPAVAEPTRRDLLAKAVLGASACAFAGVCGVAGAAVVGTPLRKSTAGAWWCPMGPLTGIAEGPSKLPVRAPGRDAFWRSERAMGRVALVREGEEVKAFSAACPHNGCDVVLGEGEAGQEWLCPCHHSRFALDGERIEGQSPRGLDPLECRVREGRLEVRFERFAYGTSERRPV